MKYTDEHWAWLREHRPKMDQNSLAAAFNDRFDACVSPKGLAENCRHKGLRAPTDGRMQPRHTPWNKRTEELISLPAAAKKLGIHAKTLRIAARNVKPAGETQNKLPLYKFSQLKTAFADYSATKAENQHYAVPQHTARDRKTCLLFRQVDKLITQSLRHA